MPEATCPSCGGSFALPLGVQSAPCDGFREAYCSEECRDQAETRENQRRASRAPWKAPESFPWDSSDPFAE
jgi:hypothetical protein